MERIKVTLLHHTPETVLLDAMEMPYRSQFTDANWRTTTKRVLLQDKHESVAEHIVFNFKIEGISRFILQELARHRLASLTVESSRFTLSKILKGEIKDVFDVYTYPPKLTPDQKIIYKHHLNKNIEILRENMESGMKNDINKSFLNESFRTNLVWTINIRSLWNFLYLRMGHGSNNPHYEIKHLAFLLFDQVMNSDVHWLFGHLDNRFKK